MDRETANKIFKYNSETGKLYWKIKPHYSVPKGKEITSQNTVGHIKVTYKAQKHFVHDLVWLIVKGGHPENHLKHINGNYQDNRIKNLEESKEIEKGIGKLGETGVFWDIKTSMFIVKKQGEVQSCFISFAKAVKDFEEICISKGYIIVNELESSDKNKKIGRLRLVKKGGLNVSN